MQITNILVNKLKDVVNSVDKRSENIEQNIRQTVNAINESRI